MEEAYPTVPEDLIKQLNINFPERCADLDWEEKKVWFYAGQRAVVRFLNSKYNEQQEIIKGVK
jgi:hypothetical protein|tara:strand:+ start:654 stop:842 length:189 start_codon:yes stop_codon:yes gene_type:complete